MQYFTSDFAAFFKELEQNNNRDWFLANKKRYETSVKKPFCDFVETLIGALSDIYPDLTMLPKEAIFRLNRDIRFSADKTPYKTHASALISPGGKKDKTTPAFYFQANHVDVRVYSGAHMLDKEQLQRVRSAIASNLKEFQQLIAEKQFVKTFGSILGEKNKRLPKDFAGLEETEPLIANKSFYYFFKNPPGVLTRDDLLDTLLDGYRVALPLNQFFEKALK